MSTFEIIISSTSILSLIISLFALNKVNKISNNNKIGKMKMSAKGDNSQQAVGSITNN